MQDNLMQDKVYYRYSDEEKKNSRLSQFIRFVTEQTGKEFSDYNSLHEWSITERAEFWDLCWDFCGIVGDKGRDILLNGDSMLDSRWFLHGSLSFTENIICRRDDKTAIVEYSEGDRNGEITYRELYDNVAALSRGLRKINVSIGDRAVSLLPNGIDIVVSMLAAAEVGAIFSSASSEFGVPSLLERFEQISPKILFVSLSYKYKNKHHSLLDTVSELCSSLDSLTHVIVFDYENHPDFQEQLTELKKRTSKVVVHSNELLIDMGQEIVWKKYAFDHPLYILFTSGTTGKPKCIVHGAGGTLLQHRKEHVLQVNLNEDDTILYITNSGWMMWNWTISMLAEGATLICRDGHPLRPSVTTFIDTIEKEKVSILGTSPRHISEFAKITQLSLARKLTSIKKILSSGSPLTKLHFKIIKEKWGINVPVVSISGGTDLISCFVLGNPIDDINIGEIQCAGLGMAVESWDESGTRLYTEKGELICAKSFPSMPICFWNDDGNYKYKSAYFSKFPNTWCHGDLIYETETNNFIIIGRSDPALNPGGIRIGSSEIYSNLGEFHFIEDAICASFEINDDVKIILFLVLRNNYKLDKMTKKHIKMKIRHNTTAAHVPACIIPVKDIPRTISGKLAEVSVKELINNRSVVNDKSLANPESLAYFSHEIVKQDMTNES